MTESVVFVIGILIANYDAIGRYPATDITHRTCIFNLFLEVIDVIDSPGKSLIRKMLAVMLWWTQVVMVFGG